jgi:hypothetical protein
MAFRVPETEVLLDAVQSLIQAMAKKNRPVHKGGRRNFSIKLAHSGSLSGIYS